MFAVVWEQRRGETGQVRRGHRRLGLRRELAIIGAQAQVGVAQVQAGQALVQSHQASVQVRKRADEAGMQ